MLDYLIYILTLVSILGIATMSFNLVAGYSGMFALSQAGFMGVGAYVSAVLLTRLHLSFVAAFIMAVMGTAILGAALASIVQKLRGDAFAVLTLWFAFVIMLVALNWTEVTRGAYGIAGVARPEAFSSSPAFFFFCFFFLLLSFTLMKRLTTSPFGRAMAVARDDAQAALTLGKDVWKVRVIAFAIASGFAGLSGALFASFVRFISPTQFGVPLLAQLLTYLVVGGLASLHGSLLGVLLLVAAREALRFLSLDPELLGALREIFLALILMLTIMYRPRGISGKVELE